MTSLVSTFRVPRVRWRNLHGVFAALLLTFLICVAWPSPVLAQYADMSGVVRDAQGAVVAEAVLQVVDAATGVVTTVTSDRQGRYAFLSLKPATYRLDVRAPGFTMLQRGNLVLTVDQRVVLDLTLILSGHTEEVTVSEHMPLLGSADGSVGTVFDSQLVQDLPVKGRSFASLATLVPGAILRPNGTTTPNLNVNGQRSYSNSLRIDGVTGLSEMRSGGVGASGERFASTITGAVNGGVSIDAVQEFRVQTSSFAAEFGRTPGAQISLVTRSGTNEFHGSAFEQFRNESMQANDWFNNARGLPEPDAEEHQFGAAAGGPILRGRTFFFGSYEGIRLQRPRSVLAIVPSREARNRPGPIGELLKAFPEPTGPDKADLTADLIGTPTEQWTTDTWGLRLDHNLFNGAQLFGRYARTPSNYTDDYVLTTRLRQGGTAQYGTLGTTVVIGSRTLLDVRGNFGESNLSEVGLDIPAAMRGWLPSGFPEGPLVRVSVSGLTLFRPGSADANLQRQYNVVGSLSHTLSAHHIKAGFDYRRLDPRQRARHIVFLTVAALPQAITSSTLAGLRIDRFQPDGATFTNVSSYIQDSWKAGDRLTVTYGLRWDVNPPPNYAEGQGPLAATAFEPPARVQMSSTQNVPLWKTNYGNVYPRLGLSMPVTSDGKTVLTGGVGVFGDLEGAAGPVGLGVATSTLPRTNVTLPLSLSDVEGLDQKSNLVPPFRGIVRATDPELGTPRTLQWNISAERLLGDRQAVLASYIGSRGDDLLQSIIYPAGVNPDFLSQLVVTTASGKSRYQAFQAQYRRRAVDGLDVLASYALATSRDNASDMSSTETRDLAPSNFDVRQTFSAAVNWSLPSVGSGLLKSALSGWGLSLVTTARSGFPFSVYSGNLVLPGQETIRLRASQVPGVPAILQDPAVPGGWRLNRAAFTNPPAGQQGDTTRNQFRAASAWLFDAALQRSFPLAGATKFILRIDAYNLLNTPIFETPTTELSSNQFGLSQRLITGAGVAAFYQSGGPRSVTVSGRFQF